jgi:hypothetical protein
MICNDTHFELLISFVGDENDWVSKPRKCGNAPKATLCRL